MHKVLLSTLLFFTLPYSFGQTKTVIGIVAFRNSGQQFPKQNIYNNNNRVDETVSIQNAVTDAFLEAKRFSLVEREKMDQINAEKMLQKNEDFIDGQVIEQSKSLGAQYIVLGDVSEASTETHVRPAPYAGTITTVKCDLDFSIKIVDVSTGEIMASSSFHGSGKGKKALENAIADVKPGILKLIRENFKVTIPFVSIEEKRKRGEATVVLIAGGNAIGIKAGNELKIYETSEVTVDGKKMSRQVTIAKVTVSKVEDENFSDCTVDEGGDEITKKMDAGVKMKCELINE